MSARNATVVTRNATVVTREIRVSARKIPAYWLRFHRLGALACVGSLLTAVEREQSSGRSIHDPFVTRVVEGGLRTRGEDR